MDSSYAPLGPIVSIVPTERRSGPVALAVAAVALLLLGFLALAATMVLRGDDAASTPATPEAAQASVLGAAPSPDPAPAPAPVAAAPAATTVAANEPAPTHDSPPAAAPAAATEDEPQARSERPSRSHRRVARRTRHARARHASRAVSRRQERPAPARATARNESRSDEPRRLTPTRPAGGGFGNSADVMRSLGL